MGGASSTPIEASMIAGRGLSFWCDEAMSPRMISKIMWTTIEPAPDANARRATQTSCGKAMTNCGRRDG
ncbi:MAG: hypothetical protein QM775_11545 [Pirellulales bacterium]